MTALVLVLAPQLAFAQTDVSGVQSGTWAAADSPFRVTGQVTVPSGQTLTIEPGVEVNFQGHYKLTVNGNLQALGVEGSPILFTTDNPATGWGGIRISSGDISRLAHCRIEYGKTVGSYPDVHGGGLALLGSDAVVTNCVFADNDATGGGLGMGGAVYANGTGGASQTLTRFVDCRFERNHAYGEGGAIKFTGDLNTEIVDCEFVGNDCGYGGGAVSCYGVFGTRLVGCLFVDNYTMYASGGALNTLGFGNSVFMINCTLSGNSAVTGDGGAVSLAYAQAYFVNTIVYDNPGMYSDDVFLDWGGQAQVHYCNMPMPAGASGSHNLDENPRFVNAAALDFRLSEISPCIDTGTAFLTIGADTLVDLSPGQYEGLAPDMGAFEFASPTAAPTASSTGFRLHQNHPNPFTAGTTLRYDLPARGHVSIRVFDVLGREVRSLVDADQAAGSRSVSWRGLDDSGRPVGPGTYFVRLRAGMDEGCVRVVLLH